MRRAGAGFGEKGVELNGIGPGREVRVLAVGEFAGTIAGDEALGTLDDPGMIGRDVVGDKVEDELEVPAGESWRAVARPSGPPRAGSAE